MTERPRVQRAALVVVGWLGAAALATAVTLAAVSSIGDGIFGSSSGALDSDEIADALAASPPVTQPSEQPAQTPDPTGSPSPEQAATEPPAAAEPTVIATSGGTVVARCSSDDLVEVVSWSPAQGFRVDNAERGPAREVEVEFESGDDDIEVKVQCVDGLPADVAHDDD